MTVPRITTIEEKMMVFSDAELEQEVKRRKEVRRQKAIDDNNKRLEALKDVLDLTLLNTLVPDHGRTSCSDDNRCNSFSSAGDDRSEPRCPRCALLEFIEGDFEPNELWELVVDIRFRRLTTP